ncbi:hypothetical protein [Mycobacterium sp.]|uniref:hypothetical protein n=1 Tax=Mycobacterium sp. TaxID=1785 RepID=UPI003A89B12A
MRIGALIAISLLVAGCSHATDDHWSDSHTTTPPGAPASPATSAPAAGAPIAAVIAWIEAAHPVDPAGYHVATRDGAVTQLDTDIAFSVPGAETRCTTDAEHAGDVLACLVELSDPPPRPATAYGEWRGGWVDFDGITLRIGSARGDPGPFVHGPGTELADGDSLFFDNFRCRADPGALYCVNYAHRSAVRFGAAGIEAYGCLRPAPPPDGTGIAFDCR